MKTRLLAFACLASLAALSQADLSFGLSGASGAPTTTSAIADFGMSRIHMLEGSVENSVRHYHPGRPTYGNITFRTGIDTAPDITEWINGLFKGHPNTREGWVFNRGPRQTTSMKCSGVLPVKWSAPECDSHRSIPSGLQMDLAMTDVSIDHSQSPPSSAKQKAWLCSNFRLRIGDLPCSRVNKIESITIKQRSLDDLDHDLWSDLTTSDLIFTIPTSDMEPFMEWFNEGKEGPGARDAKISYLNRDGSTLASLSMTAHIWSISPDPFLNPGTGFTTIKCTVKLNVWASTNK